VPTDLLAHRLAAHRDEVRDVRWVDRRQEKALLDSVPHGQARRAGSRRRGQALADFQRCACSLLTRLWLSTAAESRDRPILATPTVRLEVGAQEADKGGEARA
jgi:hypothetical protein